jgi:hydrogenase assembly chaperone HypC/HupF
MRCTTCSDGGLVGRVLEIEELTAIVTFDGDRHAVAIDLVEPVSVGDLLLCHAGIAIEKLETVS